ncbi:DUF2170 family protein [Paraneptunicella aestuarii]|uniref:DUF2170 family protein n=1 Tax=Paraneptunicella aestuarii TaxID=2831148 RepID=UPI001E63EA21|nr:DUF2170 family protein [Paraneptunicella aestuarii]UAA39387.1 DUF2170 family protein [Paraneptunicella aestuarii]
MSWDLDQLEALISKQADLVVTKENDCLLIANADGLDAWMAISGEQILVESILFAKSEVSDTNALNELILKTHMLFPLTTVGISDINGEQYYTAFGSLSSQSKESSILIEVDTLFQNVESFLDAYQEFIK